MRVIFLMIVMLIAVSASVLVLKFSGNQQPQPTVIHVAKPQPAPKPEIQTVDVLVARQEIPIGSIIEPNMIDRQPWPSHLVLEGFVTADSPDATSITGMVARAPFQSREPLISSKLANPNDPSFLAASLPQGKRAITIAVDAVSGVAGYIFPGDRVDVLLTHNLQQELSGSQNGPQRPGVAEVLISNVKVLGINLRGSGAPGQVQPPSSVSLEVDETEAQKLRLGERVGALSLVLRSLQDGTSGAIASPTDASELSHAGLTSTGAGVTIIRGAGDNRAGGFSGGSFAPPPGLGAPAGLPGGF